MCHIAISKLRHCGSGHSGAPRRSLLRLPSIQSAPETQDPKTLEAGRHVAKSLYLSYQILRRYDIEQGRMLCIRIERWLAKGSVSV